MDLLVYALLFTLAFERIPSTQFHEITLRIPVFLLAACLLIGVPYLIIKKRATPISNIDTSIGAYLGVAILSILLASTRGRALEVFVFLLFVVAGYFVTSRFVRTTTKELVIIRILIAGGVVTSLYGLYQFFGDRLGLSIQMTGLAPQYSHMVFAFARVQSVALEPLYFASYLFIPLFVLSSLIASRKKAPHIGEVVSLIVMSTAFILAVSRGAYLAAAVSIPLFLLFGFWRKLFTKNILWVAVSLLLAGAVSYGSLQAVSGSQGVQTFSTHAVGAEPSHAASINPRLNNFHEALRLFKMNPILGVGLGNYGVINSISPHVPGHGYMIVNNQYLEVLAETGCIGLLAFLYLIYSIGTAILRSVKVQKHPWLITSLAAAFIAVLVQYLTFSTIYMIHVWILIALIEALTWRALHSSQVSE